MINHNLYALFTCNSFEEQTDMQRSDIKYARDDAHRAINIAKVGLLHSFIVKKQMV